MDQREVEELEESLGVDKTASQALAKADDFLKKSNLEKVTEEIRMKTYVVAQLLRLGPRYPVEQKQLKDEYIRILPQVVNFLLDFSKLERANPIRQYKRELNTLLFLHQSDELKRLSHDSPEILSINENRLEKRIFQLKHELDKLKRTRAGPLKMLKPGLFPLFYALSDAGMGQTEQIRFVNDLLAYFDFDRWKRKKETFDRIRKWQEEAMRRRDEYGN